MLERLCRLANRGPDKSGDNSNNGLERCGAVCCRRHTFCGVPPSNVCRRGLRERPSYGSHGDADRRLEPGPLELGIR